MTGDRVLRGGHGEPAPLVSQHPYCLTPQRADQRHALSETYLCYLLSKLQITFSPPSAWFGSSRGPVTRVWPWDIRSRLVDGLPS